MTDPDAAVLSDPSACSGEIRALIAISFTLALQSAEARLVAAHNVPPSLHNGMACTEELPPHPW